jgi:hypothetical protein
VGQRFGSSRIAFPGAASFVAVPLPITRHEQAEGVTRISLRFFVWTRVSTSISKKGPKVMNADLADTRIVRASAPGAKSEQGDCAAILTLQDVAEGKRW